MPVRYVPPKIRDKSSICTSLTFPPCFWPSPPLELCDSYPLCTGPFSSSFSCWMFSMLRFFTACFSWCHCSWVYPCSLFFIPRLTVSVPSRHLDLNTCSFLYLLIFGATPSPQTLRATGSRYHKNGASEQATVRSWDLVFLTAIYWQAPAKYSKNCRGSINTCWMNK